MAGRVNTRFVVILTVVLALLVLGVVGAWWYTARRNPARYVAQAEALSSEGLYRDAVSLLKRAYSYETNNPRRIEILMDMAETILQITPESVLDARQWMGQMEACWRKVVDLDPSYVEAASKLLELYYQQARMFPTAIQLWSQLYTASDDLAKYAPDMPEVRRYRGIAQVVRSEQLGLTDDERQRAYEDLQAALQTSPEDPQLIYHLASWHLVEAGFASRLNDTTKVQEQRQEALKIVSEASEAHPDNAEVQMARFRVLYRLAMADRDEQMLAQAQAILDDLETVLLNSDQPQLTREVASRLADLNIEPLELEDGRRVVRGFYRAEQLLRHVAKNHPDDLETLVMLAFLLTRQQQWDDAVGFLEVAAKDRPYPISIDIYRIDRYRIAAIKQLADVYLVKRENETDAARRQALLEQAIGYVNQLEQLAGEDAGIALLMRGKLALVEGRALEAVSRLEAANAQYEGSDPDLLYLLSRALRATGQTGAAAEALAQLIVTPQGSMMMPAHLELAELKLAAEDTETATRLVDRVLTVAPQNPIALALKSEILATLAAQAPEDQRQAMLDSAIQALEPITDPDNQTAVFQRARLHAMAGRLEQSRELLLAYLQQHPADVGTLQRVIQLDQQLGQPDQAIARVEQAIAARPDDKLLELLLAATKGDENLSAQVQQLIDEQNDPITRQLAMWEYYQRINDQANSDLALAEAEKINPDHPRVLRVRYEQAIRQRKFDEAQNIVERVKKLNNGAGLDYAGGAFWQGQLQMAQNNYQGASETLQRGLKEMPSNSQALYLLGQARFMLGDLRGAEETLKRSVEVKPDNVAAWYLLYQVHDRQIQHDAALDDLRKATTYSGDDPGMYMEYLNYLGLHGDQAKAIAERERIARENPEDQANRRSLAELYMRENSNDKAGQILDELLAEKPDDLANVAAKAVFLATGGDSEAGKQMLRDHVHSLANPSSSDWMVFGRFLRISGDTEAAEAAYRHAIESEDPVTQPASRELGDWLFTRREYDKAAELYGIIMAGPAKDDPASRPVVWRRYVETLLRAGKLDSASSQLDALLRAHPADADAHILRGMIAETLLAEEGLSEQRQQQLREQAELAYDQAVNLAPDMPMAYLQRARFRFNRESELFQSLVRDDLQKAIELNPTGVMQHEMMVQWYLNRNEINSAIDSLQRFVAAVPNYAPARARLVELYLQAGNRQTDLEQLLNESQQLLPNEPAWRQYRARLYMSQGQWEPAEQQLREAYELDRSPGRLVEYADLLLLRNKHQQVLDLLQEWADQLNQTPLLQAMRARALAGLGRVDEAVNAFNTALDQAGDDPQQLGLILPQLTNALPPEQQLQMLENRAEKDTQGTLGLAVARLWFMHGQPDRALEQLEDLAGRFPAESSLELDRQNLMAAAYHALGQMEQARRAYEQVIQLHPDDLAALNNLAYLLADDLDQPQEALKYAQRAAQLVDQNSANRDLRANVLDTLGWVEHKTGDDATAQETLERSVRLNPMVDNRLHLAKVLISQQRPTAARAELIAARQLAEEREDQQKLAEIQQLIQSLEATAAGDVVR